MLNSKILIQLFLLLILFLLIYIFIDKYFVKTQEKELLIQKSEIQNNTNFGDINVIKDIKYTNNNENGNLYVITAEYGEFDIINPNDIFMTNVKAEVDLKYDKESEKILLFSKFADFNNNSFETIFKEDVKIFTNEGIITGDMLHLILDTSEEKFEKNPKKKNNIIKMSNNIHLKKSSYNLKADYLELDLETKDIKIYMNDNQKIKIKPENNVSN